MILSRHPSQERRRWARRAASGLRDWKVLLALVAVASYGVFLQRSHAARARHLAGGVEHASVQLHIRRSYERPAKRSQLLQLDRVDSEGESREDTGSSRGQAGLKGQPGGEKRPAALAQEKPAALAQEKPAAVAQERPAVAAQDERPVVLLAQRQPGGGDAGGQLPATGAAGKVPQQVGEPQELPQPVAGQEKEQEEPKRMPAVGEGNSAAEGAAVGEGGSAAGGAAVGAGAGAGGEAEGQLGLKAGQGSDSQPQQVPTAQAQGARVEAAAGSGDGLLDPAPSKAPVTELERRQAAVVAALRHSWAGYVRFAWGRDELLPVTRGGEDAFCGQGATLVDALDTLWLTGLRREFDRGRAWVADSLAFKSCTTSVFETVIRVVGGLLSAFDLSHDRLFLEKAEEVARHMLPAFDTPMGFPKGSINLATGAAVYNLWAGGTTSSVLSELGTIQLEFIHLSELTGNATYGEVGERIIRQIHKLYDQGLLPYSLDATDGHLTSSVLSMGAMSDSYYEYLLKVWQLKGRTDDLYKDMWVKAMDEMEVQLLKRSGNTTYVTKLNNGVPEGRMEHLACFLGGNLALGVHLGAAEGERAQRYLSAARGLTETCHRMYTSMASGLSPEFVRVGGDGALLSGIAYNILRPEAVESMFMLYRVTGERKWQDMGWEVFQAFEKHCKVPSGGYAGLRDVTLAEPQQDNKMQSFWLAETLKYLYLLFSPVTEVPLDKYVFNTEAHPFRIGVSVMESRH